MVSLAMASFTHSVTPNIISLDKTSTYLADPTDLLSRWGCQFLGGPRISREGFIQRTGLHAQLGSSPFQGYI